MSYKLRERPNVRVVEPRIFLPKRRSDVHVYGSDDTLCLYYPGEWKGTELIAETIIPWTSEWLLYYEVWSVTGKWHGGGIHLEKKAV